MNDAQEKELIERTLQGEKNAFEVLIRRFEKPIMNYIGRMVQDREMALDFTQEVFLRAYASLPSFKPRYKFSTWLFRIASNLIIDHWRKKKIVALSLSEPFPDHGLTLDVPDERPSLIHQFEVEELRRRVEKALTRVPLPLRELFIWRHINGLSYEEMAEIKALPVGTVKNRVYQAKEAVRRLIEENP